MSGDKNNKLHKIIENEREKLEKIIASQNFNLKSKKILQASEKMDILINEFYYCYDYKK